MKKWIAALAALGIAVGLTACGGRTDAPAQSKPQMLTPDSKPVGDEQLGQPAQTDPFQGTDFFNDKVEIHRLVEQIDFSAEGVPYCRSVFAYDDAGHLVSWTTDRGEITEIWNDELYIFEYIYGPYNGTMNTVNTWRYDDQGHLTAQLRKIRDEDQTDFHKNEDSTYDYTVNGNGEIIECVLDSFNGMSECLYKFAYEDGRVTNVTGYSASGKQFQAQTYSYDAWGRLEKETYSEREGDFSYIYSYDNAGRCVKVSRYVNDGSVDSWFELVYDKDGRLTEKTLMNPHELIYRYTYSYDANGFLTQMQEERGDGRVEVTRYTCDDHGNVIAADYADGTRSEYTYEKCRVTREEKECLERQLRMINADESMHRNPSRTFYYHLIPNPVW